MVVVHRAPERAARISPHREDNVRRIIKTAGVATTAAVIALAVPLSAHAATGWFKSGDARVQSPEDGRCYTMASSKLAYNMTDSKAYVFTETGCQGWHSDAIGPYSVYESPFSFSSVRFGSPY